MPPKLTSKRTSNELIHRNGPKINMQNQSRTKKEYNRPIPQFPLQIDRNPNWYSQTTSHVFMSS